MNAAHVPDRIEFGNLSIVGAVPRVASKELRLTTMEYLLLEALAKRADQVVAQEELLAAMYGRADRAPVSGVMNVLLYRLRGKLKEAGATVRIGAARGRGYRLQLAEGGAS